MRPSRRHLRSATRHALAVAALLAQVVAAVGVPTFPSRGPAKGGSAPFPCRNHPCGCGTPEEGWAGDCCCFTLEQKLAWAEERGIEPPPHVRATVEARRVVRPAKVKPSCCAKAAQPAKSDCCRTAEDSPEPADEPVATPAPAVRWVLGVYAQKCRGDGPDGVLKFDAGGPPDRPEHPLTPPPPDRFAPPVSFRTTSIPTPPPTPPPRAS